MNNFCNTLLHCDLLDLGYSRNIFTWNNGREDDAFVQLSLTGHVQQWSGNNYSHKLGSLIFKLLILIMSLSPSPHIL